MTDFILYTGPEYTTLVPVSSRAIHWIAKPEESKNYIANEQVEDCKKFLASRNFIVKTEDEVSAELN